MNSFDLMVYQLTSGITLTTEGACMIVETFVLPKEAVITKRTTYEAKSNSQGSANAEV